MRRPFKVTTTAARVPLRKTGSATAVSPIALRNSGAAAVMPRVRDSLLLRVVVHPMSVHPRNPSHGSGAR